MNCDGVKKVERYNIYFSKYDTIAKEYVRYIKVLVTDDVYLDFKKLTLSPTERIDKVVFVRPALSQERIDKLWEEKGYYKINDTTWVKRLSEGENTQSKTDDEQFMYLYLEHKSGRVERHLITCFYGLQFGDSDIMTYKTLGEQRKLDMFFPSCLLEYQISCCPLEDFEKKIKEQY